jgi:hypothetical protein
MMSGINGTIQRSPGVRPAPIGSPRATEPDKPGNYPAERPRHHDNDWDSQRYAVIGWLFRRLSLKKPTDRQNAANPNR